MSGSIFTTKHYNQIAKLLAELDQSDEIVAALAVKFCAFFQKDNEKFNKKKFVSTITKWRTR